ncbi:MAG: hypothetical protein ACK58X_07465 [Planctomycetota bacterium]
MGTARLVEQVVRPVFAERPAADVDLWIAATVDGLGWGAAGAAAGMDKAAIARIGAQSVTQTARRDRAEDAGVADDGADAQQDARRQQANTSRMRVQSGQLPRRIPPQQVLAHDDAPDRDRRQRLPTQSHHDEGRVRQGSPGQVKPMVRSFGTIAVPRSACAGTLAAPASTSKTRVNP